MKKKFILKNMKHSKELEEFLVELKQKYKCKELPIYKLTNEEIDKLVQLGYSNN